MNVEHRRRRTETISFRDYTNYCQRIYGMDGVYYANQYHSGPISDFFCVMEPGYESMFRYVDPKSYDLDIDEDTVLVDATDYVPMSYEMAMYKIMSSINAAMYAMSEYLFDQEQFSEQIRIEGDPVFRERMEEAFFDIFGRPKVLRWKHRCMNCIPMFTHDWYDVYFCPNHMDQYAAYLVVRSPKRADTFNMGTFETQQSLSVRRMVSAALGNQEFTYNADSYRMMKVALRYLFDNYRSFVSNDASLREYERQLAYYNERVTERRDIDRMRRAARTA